MPSKTREGNDLFAAVEQRICRCGCGQSFFVSGRAKRRLYIDDTHKKRAARRLQKVRRLEATASLTSKGWMYLHIDEEAVRFRLWKTFTDTEKLLIHLMCDTGIEPDELSEAAAMLALKIDGSSLPF